MNDARTRYHTDLLQQQAQQTLLGLLISRRAFGVTDPRDIIYGHLGVAGLPVPEPKSPGSPAQDREPGDPWIPRDSFQMLTTADYSKTPSQVLNEFTYDVLRWSQNYGVFSYMEDMDPSERRDGLVSWAVDWNTDPLRTPPLLDSSRKINFRGEISLRPVCQLVQNTPQLVVIGEGMAAIKRVSKVIPGDASEIIDTGERAAIFARGFDSWHCDDDISKRESKRLWLHVSKLYLEAIGSDLLQPSEERVGPGGHRIYDKGRLKRCSWIGNFEFYNVFDLLFFHTFQMKDRSILSQRRIALLESGKYAVIPAAARSGDVVSIFFDFKR